MKMFVRHIKSISLMLFAVLGMSSCIFDDEPGKEPFDEEEQQRFFVLHISPLNIGLQTTDRVAEKIKTLRVIVIGKDENDEEIIEVNHLETNGNDVLASDLKYTYTWEAKPGKKDFYIIANEDYACGADGKIKYIGDNCPKDVDIESVSTLKKLLDLERYKPVINTDEDTPDESADGSDSNATDSYAKELRNVLKAIYFEPKYEIGNNEIFLPYTTFYEDIDMQLKTNNNNGYTMYLVPVATKFFFKFYNYRQNAVEIKNLSIKLIASQNFLLGHVEENDLKKDFDGVEMYWVDWLAKVAEKTQDGQLDNWDINERYGWISAYQLPETNKHAEAVLINVDNVKTIPVWTEEKKDFLYLGPYYFPESCYKQEGNTTQEQDYLLHLYLHDREVDSSTSNDFDEDLRIENVKALFRDTCVLIQVTMKKGDVEVYAEMAPWEHEEVSGWADGGSIIP